MKSIRAYGKAHAAPFNRSSPAALNAAASFTETHGDGQAYSLCIKGFAFSRYKEILLKDIGLLSVRGPEG
jgi:hypothetical protein